MKRSNKLLANVICLLAVLSITLNAASPVCISNVFSQLPVGRLIENQNILQVYSQMSVIPINILNSLMGVKSLTKNIARKASPADSDRQHKAGRTSSDISFTPVQILESMSRYQSDVSLKVFNAYDGLYCLPSAYNMKLLIDGSGFMIILMFMLVFLVNLRRSSLPAPNRILFALNIIQSLDVKGWFFYLQRSSK